MLHLLKAFSLPCFISCVSHRFVHFSSSRGVQGPHSGIVWCRFWHFTVWRKLINDGQISRNILRDLRPNCQVWRHMKSKLFPLKGTWTRFLLASNWFINNGIDWCMRETKIKTNFYDKFYLYTEVSLTYCQIFKGKVIANSWACFELFQDKRHQMNWRYEQPWSHSPKALFSCILFSGPWSQKRRDVESFLE